MKLRELKGVGEKTEKLFEKLGIYSAEDLLQYYPRTYETIEGPREISSLEPGKTAAVLGTVTGPVQTSKVRNLNISTVQVSDPSGRLTMVWYNMPFLRNTLRRGSVFVFRGKLTEKNGRLQMEQPEQFLPAAYEQIKNTLRPIYALTSGITSRAITKLVKQILEEGTLLKDCLPENIKEQYHLADYNYALQVIHFPKNMEELLIARRRLVFDEFFFFILGIQMLKGKTEEAVNAFPMKATWTTETLIESLPYTLTRAQQKVWYEIENDLKGHGLMSRLVQGDVGSGKTILAFLAMIMTAENGYQAALMAPTEVLARQHYQAFCKLQEEYLQPEAEDKNNSLPAKNLSSAKDSSSNKKRDKFRPILLTGSNTAREKRIAYEKIASGEANLIIGTHALIQEKVTYQNLALVITDEQHRFGVKQREALTTRGEPPNVLVMSATPIPRTLAIILYGDLDISVLDELPAKRLPIKNCVVDTGYRPKAYSFIRRQLQEGRQAYIICPMVEESEGMEGENVLDYTAQLQELFPPEIKIAALHGKMKPKEKNRIMEAFAANEIQILVSTTVVEVGVDVPNATVIMIENAERFGLAQLHQLRGRVGRGGFQSYCIFMQGNNEEETSRRLKILNTSNDGFYIAGEDLKLRGPGDLFGIRQSGALEFRLADIYNDAAVLKLASEAAGALLSGDPFLTLPQNQRISDYLHTHILEKMTQINL